jgi:hypothetical protein
VKIFLSSQGDGFQPLFSGAWPAAAADVPSGDLGSVGGENNGTLQDMGQFANISRPRVLLKGVERARREAPAGRVSTEAHEQMAGERWKVVEPFAQRRDLERKDGEAVVEVKTEGAVDDTLLKVAMRGGDDADVYPRHLVVADALEFAALEEAEQLGLNGERELSDLVEEERPPVRSFDAAGAGLDGSGEGAAGVSEELGLEKRLGDRSAVEHRQGL